MQTFAHACCQVLQLKMSRRLGSISTMAQGVSIESESECGDDDDDLDTQLRTHELTLTESCCGFLPGDDDVTAMAAASTDGSAKASPEEAFSSSTWTKRDTRPSDIDDSLKTNSDTCQAGASDSSNSKQQVPVDLDKTPTQDSAATDLFLWDDNNTDDLAPTHCDESPQSSDASAGSNPAAAGSCISVSTNCSAEISNNPSNDVIEDPLFGLALQSLGDDTKQLTASSASADDGGMTSVAAEQNNASSQNS